MRELERIARAIESAPVGGTVVLATLMRVAGSAYRGPGARMVVMPDGTRLGAISGGCLEKDVAVWAERMKGGGPASAVAPAAAGGGALAIEYDLTSDDDLPWGLNLGCAAKLDVLLEALPGGRVPEHLAFVLEQLMRREPAVVATVFRAPEESGVAPGSRLMLSEDGKAAGPLAATGGELTGSLRMDAERVMREQRSDAVSYKVAGGAVEALVEYVPCPVQLVLFGGGTDVEPMCRLGREVGWQVRVVDGDEPMGQLDDRTAVVLMTHNYARDLALMEELAKSRARYWGVLGPKARTERLIRDLGERGRLLSDVQGRRLHAPVGLDVGAETPEEIALAVVAEVQAEFGGRSGGKLRERKGAIHDRR